MSKKLINSFYFKNHFIRSYYKMSKSTPLSSLPSLQENQPNRGDSNAYNENENQLVNEILQEIEGKQPGQPAQGQPGQGQPGQGQPVPQQQRAPNPAAKPNMPMPPPQMAQHNQMGMPPISREEMINRQMQRQAMLKAQQAQNGQVAKAEEEDLSFQDRIVNMLKMPAVVALICVLLALPQVTNILNGFLIGKESLARYANILVPLIKGLLGAGLYFVATQAL
jgi:hypothetical protein